MLEISIDNCLFEGDMSGAVCHHICWEVGWGERAAAVWVKLR